MEAVQFEQSNFVFKRPPDMTEEQCGDLSVFRGKNEGGMPVIISCWQPTPEELEEINRTGKVWLSICGTGMPPVCVLGHFPFVTEKQPDVQP